MQAPYLPMAVIMSTATTAIVRLGDALFATGEPEPTSVITQAGVFTIALGIAYWLLKRSDSREATAAQAAKIERDILQNQLDDERRSHEKQLEAEREAHRATMKELTDLLREMGRTDHRRD